jgi:hypothetical protein
MGRFDWKSAIVSIAAEVEGAVMCARWLEREGWGTPADLRAKAASKASYAAWLARSYYRKGRRIGGTP